MEEIYAAISYLIRERFWCSIRTLIDKVSTSDAYPYKGIAKRPGPTPKLLESLRYLQ
jgi:hypothetical protein